jgi:nucleoprotein TPR
LESEVEARKAEGKALLEDNTRWKGRAQQILEKYERIDPVEHDNLKASVSNLSAEKAALEAKLASSQSTMDAKIKEKTERVTFRIYFR